MFKFYIDSQLTDQPDNDMELITTIKRDSDSGGFLTTQEVTLSYSANDDLEAGTVSGYTLCKTAFDSGTCNELEIVIYDEQTATETYRVYTGVIKVPSMQIDEQNTKLSSKVEDNSFYSYIKNNKNVQFSLYATQTKNGQIITPPDIYEVDMFDSATGVFLSTIGNLYQGYRLYDVLRFLVPAISDNKITFESEFLRDVSPHLFIFDGAALANPNTQPEIVTSFEQIRSELFKLKNLMFYIDMTDPDAPVLRMEPQEWFYTAYNVLSFDEPLVLKTSVKTSKLFGTINVGSEYNPGGAASIYTWNAGTSYYGWKKEIYTPLGQCNLEVELNLVNEFLISSNAINDQVNGATTSNLDSMFIVETFDVDDVALTATAYNYSFPTGLPYYYNFGLNNVNKIGLHGGNFQSALTNTQDGGTDVFRAALGQDTTLMNQNAGSGLVSTYTGTPAVVYPVPFADESSGNNTDPGGNYLNTNPNYYYTVPVDGDYSFSAGMHLEAENLLLCTTNNPVISAAPFPTQYVIYYTLSIEVYADNTFAVLLNSSTQTFFIGTDGTYNFTGNLVDSLVIGNVVRVRSSAQFRKTFPTLSGNSPVLVANTCGYTASQPKALLIALEDSYFTCNGTPEGGAILAQPNPELYKVKLHEFEYPITSEDFRSILATPLGSFEFTKNEVTRVGWIEQMIHTHQTGATKIILVSQDATT